MIKLLHFADLHLSSRDEAYGFAVLDEILELAGAEAVDFIIISGDLFDTFKDIEALRGPVRDRFAGLENCEVLFIPGNHEELRRGAGDPGAFDWGRIRLLNEKPAALLSRERKGLSIEFLALPHGESYDDYRDWNIAEKQADVRVALAHGLLAGQVYAGPDEEQGGGALDPDLFTRHKVDYAALGHVHRGRILQMNDCVFAYPGSARVWRSGEIGPHGVYLLELDGGPVRRPTFRPLKSAGVFRRVELPLGLDGHAPGRERLGRDWDAGDWIQIVTTGIVEDENVVARLEAEIQGEWGGRLRRLEFERRIEVLPDIAAHPVARKFLENWEARFAETSTAAGPSGAAALLRARELALQEIKTALE